MEPADELLNDEAALELDADPFQRGLFEDLAFRQPLLTEPLSEDQRCGLVETAPGFLVRRGFWLMGPEGERRIRLGAGCAEGGVLGILPGVIGGIQATETVKLLLGKGEPL